ncbi:hypothetical protein D3C77_689550 [compost metagenome]
MAGLPFLRGVYRRFQLFARWQHAWTNGARDFLVSDHATFISQPPVSLGILAQRRSLCPGII